MGEEQKKERKKSRVLFFSFLPRFSRMHGSVLNLPWGSGARWEGRFLNLCFFLLFRRKNYSSLDPFIAQIRYLRDIFWLNGRLQQHRFGGQQNSVHNTTHVKASKFQGLPGQPVISVSPLVAAEIRRKNLLWASHSLGPGARYALCITWLPQEAGVPRWLYPFCFMKSTNPHRCLEPEHIQVDIYTGLWSLLRTGEVLFVIESRGYILSLLSHRFNKAYSII